MFPSIQGRYPLGRHTNAEKFALVRKFKSAEATTVHAFADLHGVQPATLRSGKKREADLV